MKEIDATTIREWIREAEAKLSVLTDEADRIQRDLAQVRSQLQLLYELLATITGEEVPEDSNLEKSGKSIREEVVEAVTQILRDQGAPMRIQDIHSEFLRRELPLPGRGTPGNIAAHLVDREIFTRPRRGTFGLVEWEATDA